MSEADKDGKARTASPEAAAKPVDEVTAPVEGVEEEKVEEKVDEKGDDKSDEKSDEKSDDKSDEKSDENADAPAAAAADDATEDATATPAKPAKTHVSLARRKSVGPKLNRKGSKARITHLDAKPGEHYFVKLKGYPAWPVVICDEDMLPQTLLKARPVSAARPDGSYREDYAEGGKRAADRTFPVMYLATNEFGWVPNTDLHDLDPSKVIDAINDKMRKDLQHAHQIAAENNPLTYFKDLLRQFQEEIELEEQRQREAAAKRLSTPKKAAAKKSKSEDVDMLDVPEDDDDEPVVPKKSASKKRKADDDAIGTPQRSDSVKKPKIKITSSGTPKSNGTAAAATSASASAATKTKTSSKAKESAVAEPEPTPEEKRRRKAKEVLFLRHKIQKGLLPRESEIKEDDMEEVSDFLTKLEGFPDLEVGVIRETKINKVLKAILKVATIPREDDYHFKPRSQALLEKWNKLLAAAPPVAAAKDEAKSEAKANGTKDEAKEAKESKDESKEAKDEAKKPENAEDKSNGTKEDDKAEDKAEDKADDDKADKVEAPAAVEAEA